MRADQEADTAGSPPSEKRNPVPTRVASAASIAAAGPNEAVPYRSPMPVPLTSVKIRADRPEIP